VYQLRQGWALLPADQIEWRTPGIRKAGKLLDVDKITLQRGGLQSFGLDDQSDMAEQQRRARASCF
jgi:hypothetical protein